MRHRLAYQWGWGGSAKFLFCVLFTTTYDRSKKKNCPPSLVDLTTEVIGNGMGLQHHFCSRRASVLVGSQQIPALANKLQL